MKNIVLPTTIEGVIEHIEQIIETSKKDKSRMGYFAALYKRVTVSVKKHIEEGYFDDNERMEKLDVIFANRYLEAYYAYQNGEECSLSWKIAFDATKLWSPLVIQQLFIGMNAHIGLDLGIAAAEVQPKNIESLHSDFNKINTVLGNLVNEVQDELSTIFWPLKIIDVIAGSVDEKIAKFSMDIARDAAWQVALDYLKFPTPEGKEVYIKSRDRKVAKFGLEIIFPKRWIQILILVCRILEKGTIRYKIKVLNRNR